MRLRRRIDSGESTFQAFQGTSFGMGTSLTAASAITLSSITLRTDPGPEIAPTRVQGFRKVLPRITLWWESP